MEPSFTNLVLIMEKSPCGKGFGDLSPFLSWGKTGSFKRRKCSQFPGASGEMLWCLSQRESTKPQLDKGSSTVPYTTGTSTSPWAAAELQGGSEQWCLCLAFPAFFTFLSVGGSSAFIALEASYSCLHSQEKPNYQNSSVRMRQGAPSHLLTPN